MKDAKGHGSDSRGGSVPSVPQRGEAAVHALAAAHGIDTSHLSGPDSPALNRAYANMRSMQAAFLNALKFDPKSVPDEAAYAANEARALKAMESRAHDIARGMARA